MDSHTVRREVIRDSRSRSRIFSRLMNARAKVE